MFALSSVAWFSVDDTRSLILSLRLSERPQSNKLTGLVWLACTWNLWTSGHHSDVSFTALNRNFAPVSLLLFRSTMTVTEILGTRLAFYLNLNYLIFHIELFQRSSSHNSPWTGSLVLVCHPLLHSTESHMKKFDFQSRNVLFANGTHIFTNISPADVQNSR